MSKCWYFHYEGKTMGPLTSSQLKSLASTQIITPETAVRLGRAGKWVLAQKVRGLFESSVSQSVKSSITQAPDPLQSTPTEKSAGPPTRNLPSSKEVAAGIPVEQSAVAETRNFSTTRKIAASTSTEHSAVVATEERSALRDNVSHLLSPLNDYINQWRLQTDPKAIAKHLQSQSLTSPFYIRFFLGSFVVATLIAKVLSYNDLEVFGIPIVDELFLYAFFFVFNLYIGVMCYFAIKKNSGIGTLRDTIAICMYSSTLTLPFSILLIALNPEIADNRPLEKGVDFLLLLLWLVPFSRIASEIHGIPKGNVAASVIATALFRVPFVSFLLVIVTIVVLGILRNLVSNLG